MENVICVLHWDKGLPLSPRLHSKTPPGASSDLWSLGLVQEGADKAASGYEVLTLP